MDAGARIIETFDRLVEIGREAVASRPFAERVVYHVVAARCEIDMSGFASVYEQLLNKAELDVLIAGLERIAELALAAEFRLAFELLERDGFYEHMNWDEVPEHTKDAIDEIGRRVGDAAWNLDDKLAGLLAREDERR